MDNKYIPMHSIDFNHIDNARKLDVFDCSRLALSISKYGLLQPIGVYPNGDRYKIIWGFRRYVAHRHLGLDTIWSVILSPDLAQEINAEENLCRRSLTIEEEVHLVEVMGERVKSVLSVSNYWYKVRLAISKAHKPIREKIYSGELPPEAALNRRP